jgi:hypothetical protein
MELVNNNNNNNVEREDEGDSHDYWCSRKLVTMISKAS